jgi:hypothetical protein
MPGIIRSLYELRGHTRSIFMHERCVRYIAVGVLMYAALVCGRTDSYAQPTECKYRDVKGNCVSKPLFPAEPKTPAQRQQIIVSSEPPEAEVFIDGEKLGVTPLRLRKRLAPGEHELLLRLDGYAEKKKTITVEAHGKQSFGDVLLPQPKLRIQFLPGEPHPQSATLYVDDEERGLLSDHPIDLTVEPGKRRVRVTSPDHNPFDTVLEAEPGITYQLYPRLTRPVGSIWLTSNLRGVPFYLLKPEECNDIDPNKPGERAQSDLPRRVLDGEIPVLIQALSPTTHCLEFRVPKIGTYRRMVPVSLNEVTKYKFALDIEMPESVDLEEPPDAVLKRLDEQCKMANDGDAGAKKCLELGWLHQRRGRNEQAAELYSHACALGSSLACESYGWMLRHGKVLDPPKGKNARSYYADACEQKLTSACYRYSAIPEYDVTRSPASPHKVHRSKGAFLYPGFGLEYGGFAYVSTKGLPKSLLNPGLGALLAELYLHADVLARVPRWLQVGAVVRLGAFAFEVDRLVAGELKEPTLEVGDASSLLLAWRVKLRSSDWSISGGLGPAAGGMASFISAGWRLSGTWRLDVGLSAQSFTTAMITDDPSSEPSSARRDVFFSPFLRATWIPTVLWFGDFKERGHYGFIRL